MLETESSPLLETLMTSLLVLPSEPGAPSGHNGISLGSSEARRITGARKKANRIAFIPLSNLFQTPRGIAVFLETFGAHAISHAEEEIRQGSLYFHVAARLETTAGQACQK